MNAPIDLAKILERYAIHDRWLFYSVAALLVSYLLYTMIRRRKGDRPGQPGREPDL